MTFCELGNLITRILLLAVQSPTNTIDEVHTYCLFVMYLPAIAEVKILFLGPNHSAACDL